MKSSLSSFLSAVQRGAGAARVAAVAATAIACAAAPLAADVVELCTSEDNSLVETRDGSLSLALSEFVFAGRVGNHGGNAKLRRGLLRFDIEGSVPRGSTIECVELHLFCAMTNSGAHTVSLHRAEESWGEGESFAQGGAGAPATPGDATWLHRFWPEERWLSAGGDFAPGASAACIVAFPGPYTWECGEGLVGDVQSWLDDPATNHGWVVVGDEPFVQSVKAFASRENVVERQRPRLVVTYAPPAVQRADVDGDGVVGGSDLAIVLGAWGMCPEPRCAGDVVADGVVDAIDVAAVIEGWSI